MRKDHEFDLYVKQVDEDEKARDALSAAKIWYGRQADNPFLKKPRIVEAVGYAKQRDDQVSAAIGVSIPRRFADKNASRHDKVISAICYLTRLPVDQILTMQRSNRKALDARCAIASILFDRYQYSTPHIGRIIKRDHSTVIHNLRNITPAARELAHKASLMLFEIAL